MKKINSVIIKFLALVVLFSACENDDLPKANFDLDAVTVFSGEVAHEKASLIWQEPTGNQSPENYILEWSPDGERTILEATTTTYEVSNLTNGTNYRFTIQADYGDSGISGQNEIELEPSDELNFIVLPGNELAIALWDTPNRNDISGYRLSWEPNGQTIEIPFGTNTYQISGLTNDVEYSFDFQIDYSDGNSSNDVQAIATPGEISAFLLSVESPMATELVGFTYNPAYLPGSTADSWNYDFGDGNTSTEQNPTHTYAVPGIYDVIVQITDEQGTIFTDTKQVFVWGEKWAYDLGNQIKPQSPAIADDGTIYIGSEDNTNFHAINPDGTLKWTYSQLGDNVYSSASIGSDGTIYVGSKDDNLHAINPDGSQKWIAPVGSNVIYSTPSIASDGTVYIGSDDDNLYAINPDGSLKWTFNTTGFNIRSTAAIADDGTVYITSDDDNLYALNPSNGSVVWSLPLGGNAQSGIAIDSDGTIIVAVDQGGSAGAVFAVNPDGSEKWGISVTGRISVCAPAIANGRIYVGTKEGNNLLALDVTNGGQIWSFGTPGAILNSSPAIDVNGVIYFGSWDNHVYAVNPDGTLKYKFLTDGDVWSSPAIGSDGTIYVGGYDNKLHALEMFSGGLANDVWPMFGKNQKHTSR
ncbi:outer membrane protein assembly factor BamB family protein [Winogradskyella schleiferi]|uniref:outer membrane protein assembly factor BamB family protein n=1 Tax=Winogradskyella schleiferi TaxID=2686078 RepID=UPI0015C17814|nr:PQQ-binding-like beta-propeller repeat protein [Winogradskyella schleiferi]